MKTYTYSDIDLRADEDHMVSRDIGDLIHQALYGAPTPEYLDNWAWWAWAGMIVLLGALFFVATFANAYVGERPELGIGAVASIANLFYIFALTSVMRHTPRQWLVLLTALILFAGMIALLAKMGVSPRGAQGWFWSYVLVVSAHLVPVLSDRASRVLSSIPTNWSMIGLLLLIALAVLVIMLSKSSTRS